jgi:uncharacterized membrane protein
VVWGLAMICAILAFVVLASVIFMLVALIWGVRLAEKLDRAEARLEEMSERYVRPRDQELRRVR